MTAILEFQLENILANCDRVTLLLIPTSFESIYWPFCSGDGTK